MLHHQFPNKYRTPVHTLIGQHSRSLSMVSIWIFTIVLSGLFVDEIHLYGISLEQHPNKIVGSIGQTVTTWIEDHPSSKQFSKLKNDLRHPIERFYDREMRL